MKITVIVECDGSIRTAFATNVPPNKSDDTRLARWALYARLKSLLTLLLVEFETVLSADTYRYAKMLVDHSEYSLALERIALDIVPLDIEWNRELFSTIAEAMGSTASEYLDEARKARLLSGMDKS